MRRNPYDLCPSTPQLRGTLSTNIIWSLSPYPRPPGTSSESHPLANVSCSFSWDTAPDRDPFLLQYTWIACLQRDFNNSFYSSSNARADSLYFDRLNTREYIKNAREEANQTYSLNFSRGQTLPSQSNVEYPALEQFKSKDITLEHEEVSNNRLNHATALLNRSKSRVKQIATVWQGYSRCSTPHHSRHVIFTRLTFRLRTWPKNLRQSTSLEYLEEKATEIISETRFYFDYYWSVTIHYVALLCEDISGESYRNNSRNEVLFWLLLVSYNTLCCIIMWRYFVTWIR